jgi:hypothetical protein
LIGLPLILAIRRSGPGGRAEIEGAGVEEFQRLVGAERLYPADLDPVLLQGLFEKTLVLEDEADRVVGGKIDLDLLHLGRGGGEGREARGEGGGEEEAAGQAHYLSSHVPAHGFPDLKAPDARRFSCTCFAPASC